MQQNPATPTGSLHDEIGPVLKAGLCVGCGACAVRAPDAIRMSRDSDGVMQAVIADAAALDAEPGGVCPFSDATPDEGAVGTRVFGTDVPADPRLGRVRRSYAGFAAAADFRAKGSSGGMATWVLVEAMRQGMIDAVVNVHPAKDGGLFNFAVARSEAEIRAGAKTRYYSVSFDTALRDAIDGSGRIAFVGVPCFVTAVRHLAAADPAVGDALALTVAIICGHMKSPGFAESLAWQVGVAPDDIAAVDFRVKQPDRSAKMYGFSAISKATGETRMKPMAQLAGRRWDGGYFRLAACDFCDDVVGETADVSFGDAWLPEYDADPGGTNVVMVRSPAIETLIETARTRGDVTLDDIGHDRAAASQAGGFRDRRDALAYRLWHADRTGRWHPRKRVTPGVSNIGRIRRLMYRVRMTVRRRSFAALRLSKTVGSILPYRYEMTAWHKFQVLLGKADTKFGKPVSKK
ncbi:coenzyme F420-reducing hydrogenase beta subunit [Salipiger aestuarii]|uniref:Coenzyme F420-reducing hydrogenase beta subunit n=2 Tax=Salipiger aestuarii TaxID=568098 RepID=A0A327XM47_9RHOB|nr:coenzyme F420-reducing hydrogenase beta subunit [Salipiger aestuarii]